MFKLTLFMLMTNLEYGFTVELEQPVVLDSHRSLVDCQVMGLDYVYGTKIKNYRIMQMDTLNDYAYRYECTSEDGTVFKSDVVKHEKW